MTPDHWTLREWGKKTAAVAAGFILTAAVLERARASARREIEWHEQLHHSEPEGSDDE